MAVYTVMEKHTSILIQKLREQSKLSYSENTLGGIFYIMYGFVEIIENDSIFSKFIKAKIQEEGAVHGGINKALRNKEITRKRWYELAKTHITGKFWHEYYSLFQHAHSLIKEERQRALDIDKNDISVDNLSSFFLSEPRLTKRLTQEEAKFYTDDFERCIAKIMELISSDLKLLNQIEQENKEEEEGPVKISYNPNGYLGEVKYLLEQGIPFSGRRMLILVFFDNNRIEKQSYHDFNAWLIKSNYKGFKIDSQLFRQEIQDINERLHAESDFLSELINYTNKDKKSGEKVNFYKFQITNKK